MPCSRHGYDQALHVAHVLGAEFGPASHDLRLEKDFHNRSYPRLSIMKVADDDAALRRSIAAGAQWMTGSSALLNSVPRARH